MTHNNKVVENIFTLKIVLQRSLVTSRGKMGIKSEDTSEKKRAKFSYFELQKANKIT